LARHPQVDVVNLDLELTTKDMLKLANQTPIPVVNGAAGKMGREVVKAVAQAEDMTLGAIDRSPEHQGKDAGELAGLVNRWKFQLLTSWNQCWHLPPRKDSRSDGRFYPSQYAL